MNTAQLLRCVQQDELLKRYCAGVFARDTVPSRVDNLPICYIVNTDPISKPGKHWYAVFFYEDGSRECFDSYGRTPSKSGYSYNSVRIQGPLSSTCGQYCLYYLCHKVRGKNMKQIVNDFSQDYVLNDLCVTEYVNRNFDLNTVTYDTCQICSSEK